MNSGWATPDLTPWQNPFPPDVTNGRMLMIPSPGQDSFGNPLPIPASPVQGPGPAGWQAQQAQQGATQVQAAPLPNWTPGAPVQAALLPNWSVNSGIDPTQIAMPLANNTTNSSSGWLGNVVNGAARAVTDPSVTNWLRQQGQYASKAGDYVDLGGKGLGVMGLLTGQPELLAAGAGGEGAGVLFHVLGNAAVLGSDFLAGQRNRMLKDYAGAYVNDHLPPMTDSQPIVDRTGSYLGF